MLNTYMATVKVASIHFEKLTARRNYRGIAYVIPAVKLNEEPAIITVRDLIQFDEGPVINGPGGGRRQKLRHPVLGEEIAACIVGEWTGSTVHGMGMNPSCHPGVWIVRERIALIEQVKKTVNDEEMTHEERAMIDASGNQMFRAATEEERQQMWEEDLAAARAADRAYGEWCWRTGNHIFAAWSNGSKEPVPREMPPAYKKAAKQYGLEAEWLKEAAPSESTLCQNCGKPGSKLQMMCQGCNEPLDLERWAQWKTAKDQALARGSDAGEEERAAAAGGDVAAGTGYGLRSRRVGVIYASMSSF